MSRPPGITTQIKCVARDVLEQAPEGIRFADLVKKVAAQCPGANPKTVETMVQSLNDDGDVLRPSRGHWILGKFIREEDGSGVPFEIGPAMPTAASEKAFYEPFASWLASVEEEVNEAVVIGGSAFKNKWATPDVIGTYKKQPSDPVPFALELVAAEIKTDASQSVTAFGQACAYRLFSHKVYIVMPIAIEHVKDDLERLEALCALFGMGLVLFRPSLADPQFVKRIAARKYEPDMFYVNEFARRLQQVDRRAFDKLF